VDSGAHLFRVDSSVVMPLTAARRAGLPSVGTIAAKLGALLATPLAASHAEAQP
jgi:formylmethanofuran dehydrogenase subunit B